MQAGLNHVAKALALSWRERFTVPVELKNLPSWFWPAAEKIVGLSDYVAQQWMIHPDYLLSLAEDSHLREPGVYSLYTQ